MDSKVQSSEILTCLGTLPETSRQYGTEGFKENITALWYRGAEGEHHNTMVPRDLRRAINWASIFTRNVSLSGN